ncbi:exosome component 10 [Orussus abietinus]|uniref:exosome component 10 n=1 Tax=Orussus abietinus TaxID=222816 RepID=UPI000626344B|nr:exosome component 10 [Orussus abietinus]
MIENANENTNLGLNHEDDNTGATGSGDLEVVEVVSGFSKFDDYMKAGYDALKAGIKASNGLPQGENYNYYSCFSSFNNIKNGEINKLLSSMQCILELVGVGGNIRRGEIEDKFELLLEANDIFQDRAGICMDEESGITKNAGVELVVSQARPQNVTGSWNTLTSLQNHRKSNSGVETMRLLAARNIHRPQLTFKDKIDNSSKPWEPRIKDKPNSLKPLAIYLEEGKEGEQFNHPYEFELDKFQPSEHQLQSSEPIKYKPVGETPLIIIEKPEDIKILLDDLKNYDEIAIDLEHHSYRSFQGITCLMQISTRDTDYLIDTLTLRSELYELNEIFTKPSVLKVFHGADCDIQWLQRDLSLYIVNMFDTHQAAKHLNLPYLSLGYLLKHYCGVDPNKHFQLADWRIRPLPEELMKYAREDTHFLLYIKDILRNDLIKTANGKSNILKAVYDRSTEICKHTYVKPIYTEESYLGIYRKSQKMFNNKQLYALKELYKWRDITARLEDDSTAYILPNHMLLNIAETLPREMQGILACCNPIPPLVRQNLLKLHKIILKARDEPLIKPVLEEDLRQRLTQRNQAVDSDTWLYSPHDLPSGMEIRGDLPCLLDFDSSKEIPIMNMKIKPTISLFGSPAISDDEEVEMQKTVKRKKVLFVSPFERYKKVIPMIAAEEAKERAIEVDKEQERLKNIEKDKQHTVESIERVHDHFKQVANAINKDTKKSKRKKRARVLMNEIHGKKRKKESNINTPSEQQEKAELDMTNPIPSLDAAIVQGYKKKPAMMEEVQNIQKTFADSQQENSNKIKPLRGSQRNDKKNNRKELQEKGMLPSDSFNYKTVDFSSFQGGSMTNVKPAVFQPQKLQHKKSKKGNKKRKKKNPAKVQ